MKDNDSWFGPNQINDSLSELISYLSDAERQKLLESLDKWYQSKITEKRKHPRKRMLRYVDCSGHCCKFSDFMRNISAGGLFIETKTPVYIDQELTMTFTLPDFENPFNVTGKVVWANPKGIGVKLYNTISEI
jgi:Tfp pilus assembly protein PilZ